MKKKHFIIPFLFLLLMSSGLCLAQSNTSFNIAIGEKQTDLIHAHETDSFFILSGLTYDSLIGHIFIKMDKQGNILKKVIFDDSLYGDGNKYETAYLWMQDKFFHVYPNQSQIHYRFPKMVVFDYNFDTLWTKDYYNLFSSQNAKSGYTKSIVKTPDGGFLMAGYITKNPWAQYYRYYPFLLKTDQLGNPQWFKIYDDYMNYRFLKMELTHDLGILVYCDKNRGSLVKLNAIGEIQKFHALNNLAIYPELSDFCYLGSGKYAIVQAKDTSTIVYGLQSINLITFDYQNWSILKDTLYTPYEKIDDYTCLHAIAGQNHNVHIAGSATMKILDYASYQYVERGFHLKINASGNVVQNQNYKQHYNLGYDNDIYNFIPCHDGSFLGCGSVFGNNYFHGWVFKTNANGVLGFNPFAHNNQDLKISIFPNPAQDFLVFNCVEEATSDLSIQIYNAMGQKVLQTQLKRGNTQKYISISGFSKGLYIYQIMEEGSSNKSIVQSGKWIKN